MMGRGIRLKAHASTEIPEGPRFYRNPSSGAFNTSHRESKQNTWILTSLRSSG
jgi:hypothetical protein